MTLRFSGRGILSCQIPLYNPGNFYYHICCARKIVRDLDPVELFISFRDGESRA